MTRSFLAGAVGPLTGRRIGAVFGFVGGVTLPLRWIWARDGEVDNLSPMSAMF